MILPSQKKKILTVCFIYQNFSRLFTILLPGLPIVFFYFKENSTIRAVGFYELLDYFTRTQTAFFSSHLPILRFFFEEKKDKKIINSLSLIKNFFTWTLTACFSYQTFVSRRVITQIFLQLLRKISHQSSRF